MTAPQVAAERPPRAAATVVVVRDGDAGLEVLLSRRAERGDHNSGAWVFPGGIVDAADRQAHACCHGLDDAAASAKLGVAQGGLDYYVAAVRECFEEAGLLFANDRNAAPVDLSGADGERWALWRGPLHRGESSIVEFCREAQFTLAVDRLVYLSHWLTPPGRAKRFDTRFFIAMAPASQVGAHDGTEMLEQLWLRPADALARSATLKLMTPTLKTLDLLTRHATAASLLAWAAAPREVALVMPRVASGAQGVRPVLPDEYAWAEIGRLDPAGHGHCSYDLVPGQAVRLSPRVIRITADNGSMMTGPGTNTYLVGGGTRNVWAALDPGPLLPEHVQAILAAAPGPIESIFVTHTHKDHSPSALALQAATGARLLGQVAAHAQWQDTTFVPEVALAGGERFEIGDDATLRVIHTPGHASNHLCYLLEQERLLFTGDHVMQSSTVVINPPDGDMRAYLTSLHALLDVPLDWLAPGHGFLMASPHAAMRSIIAHRGRREAKLLGVLRASGPAPIDALLPRVYDDVAPRLHAMAERSLTAHLFKLRDEAVVGCENGRWGLLTTERPQARSV
jgi:glyoxylase-like metal-dependent hydrolase (beta-lactamase superfamily II)/8-oxo-dGTP pyrophosphatase MutT (NUDIX family)